MDTKAEVVVVGGGPAGIMAAVAAAQKGAEAVLLEKNRSLGKKLLLTGKGRCNVTTSLGRLEIIKAFSETGNGQFLWNSLGQFDNQDLKTFFQKRGLILKEERGHRLFPVSDQATSVLALFKKELGKFGIRVIYQTEVRRVLKKGSTFVAETSQGRVIGRRLILATGGRSYPQTGSTGDGYAFSAHFGHTVIPPRPSLVPLVTKGPVAKSLQGLTLKNVSLALLANSDLVTEQFGELLFTHFGLSGPTVFEASRFLKPNLAKPWQARIDLKPALSYEQLDRRLLREIEAYPRKSVRFLLTLLLPRKMVAEALKQTGLAASQKMGVLTKEDRRKLTTFLKDFRLEVVGTRPLAEAIVTAGGVDLKEIDPQTMQSRLCPGLFIAGELLDLDGPTGGYNLQMCFTTGYVAGRAAAVL